MLPQEHRAPRRRYAAFGSDAIDELPGVQVSLGAPSDNLETTLHSPQPRHQNAPEPANKRSPHSEQTEKNSFQTSRIATRSKTSGRPRRSLPSVFDDDDWEPSSEEEYTASDAARDEAEEAEDSDYQPYEKKRDANAKPKAKSKFESKPLPVPMPAPARAPAPAPVSNSIQRKWYPLPPPIVRNRGFYPLPPSNATERTLHPRPTSNAIQKSHPLAPSNMVPPSSYLMPPEHAFYPLPPRLPPRRVRRNINFDTVENANSGPEPLSSVPPPLPQKRRLSAITPSNTTTKENKPPTQNLDEYDEYEEEEYLQEEESQEEEDDEDKGDEEEVYSTDEEGEEYKLFLSSLVGNSEHEMQDSNENDISQLLDDEDEDFNFQKAVEKLQEDPWEYKWGPNVQAGNSEIYRLTQLGDLSLRPRTRRVVPGTKNTHSHLDPARGSSSNSSTGARGYSRSSNNVITNTDMEILHDQYAQLVSILTSVHADAARIVAMDESAEGSLPERDVQSGKTAFELTSQIGCELQGRRKTSLAFWNTIMPAHDFHSSTLGGGPAFQHHALDTTECMESTDSTDSTEPKPVVSFFDSPILENLGEMMKETTTADWTKCTPLDFVSKLCSTPHRVVAVLKPSPTGAEPGVFVAEWTKTDDDLLYMMISKHTIDFGARFTDLLPHRTFADCENRINYLNSRRSGDNPVKQFLMSRTRGLTQTELGVLQHVFKFWGRGAVYEDKLWKWIQRELFPKREISTVRRIWLYRENRRFFKINWRSKSRNRQREKTYGRTQNINQSRHV